MGMKLKSGADLCGFELSRFCVQNDVAIPDAPASGRKYFHTGTGMEGKYSLLGRERIFTGTSWRAAAYVDDLANLDLATNEDYLALKEKVDLLSGEVDTDAIISNMKEVTAFLEGFAEDANLMSVLNNKLDKENNAYYGIDFNSTATDGTARLLLKNRGVYLLGLGSDGTNAALTNYVTKEWLGLQNGTLKYYDKVNERIVLHSGNVGDYEAGSAKILSDYAGRIQSANLNSFADNGVRKFIASTSMTEGKPPYDGSILHFSWDNNMGFDQQLFLANSSQVKVNERMAWRAQHGGVWGDWKTIAFTDSTVEAAKKLVSNSGEDVLTSNGFHLYPKGGIIMNPNNEGLMIGYTSIDWHNSANTSSKTIINFNSYGNVTIGVQDLAGTSAKLYVNGGSMFGIGYQNNITTPTALKTNKTFSLVNDNASPFGLHAWIDDAGKVYFQASYIDASHTKTYPILLNPLGGNVLIGTIVDNGEKLQVNGSVSFRGTLTLPMNNQVQWADTDTMIYGSAGNTIQMVGSVKTSGSLEVGTELGVISNAFINGNLGVGIPNPQAKLHVSQDIVANGTIACKGVAAEGSAPVGTVDKWAGSIASGTKSQTYTHGLGTTDITVAIYEKNGNEWVQILTDVDIVNANTIRVTFGANTTVEHRIVVMG